MRCYICDKALTEKEITPDPTEASYEPCFNCMEIILDAADPTRSYQDDAASLFLSSFIEEQEEEEDECLGF